MPIVIDGGGAAGGGVGQIARVPVNVGTAITKALTKLPAGLPRAQFVAWFSEIARDVLNEPRVWKFLTQPVSVEIIENQVALPDGTGELVSIQIGDLLYTMADQLSDADALAVDNETMDQQGFTLDSTSMLATFHPGATGTALVTVEQDITSDYEDEAYTIFPDVFSNLFVIGLRMHWYDKQKDGRFTKEHTLYQMELSKVKAWDNRLKPVPHFNRHGYTR